jgi:carnitine 3-dehydrogenase
VAVLQGLRSHHAGAGAVLAEHERALFDMAHPRVMGDGDDLSRPLRLHRARIPADWVDYNGHMTESRYLELTSEATDAVLRYLGVDGDYLATTGAYYTAESHVSFLDELHAEDMVEVTSQLLGSDDRRLHVHHRVVRPNTDDAVAECETMLVHVAKATGRSGPASPEVARRVERLTAAQASLPRPERSGRRVGERRRATC